MNRSAKYRNFNKKNLWSRHCRIFKLIYVNGNIDLLLNVLSYKINIDNSLSIVPNRLYSFCWIKKIRQEQRERNREKFPILYKHSKIRVKYYTIISVIAGYRIKNVGKVGNFYPIYTEMRFSYSSLISIVKTTTVIMENYRTLSKFYCTVSLNILNLTTVIHFWVKEFFIYEISLRCLVKMNWVLTYMNI